MFGVKDTLACLEMGAVETLIVWENLDVQRYVFTNPSSGGIPPIPTPSHPCQHRACQGCPPPSGLAGCCTGYVGGTLHVGCAKGVRSNWEDQARTRRPGTPAAHALPPPCATCLPGSSCTAPGNVLTRPPATRCVDCRYRRCTGD